MTQEILIAVADGAKTLIRALAIGIAILCGTTAYAGDIVDGASQDTGGVHLSIARELAFVRPAGDAPRFEAGFSVRHHDMAIVRELHAVNQRADIEPISIVTRLAAHETILACRGLAASMAMVWRAPNISTEGNGDVTLEWLDPSARSLSIHVNADGSMEYLKAWGPDIDNDMNEGRFFAGDFVHLWEWLHEVV